MGFSVSLQRVETTLMLACTSIHFHACLSIDSENRPGVVLQAFQHVYQTW